MSEEFLEEYMVITYYSMGYHVLKRKRKEGMKYAKESKEKLQRSKLYPWKDFRAQKGWGQKHLFLSIIEKENV